MRCGRDGEGAGDRGDGTLLCSPSPDLSGCRSWPRAESSPHPVLALHTPPLHPPRHTRPHTRHPPQPHPRLGAGHGRQRGCSIPKTQFCPPAPMCLSRAQLSDPCAASPPQAGRSERGRGQHQSRHPPAPAPTLMEAGATRLRASLVPRHSSLASPSTSAGTGGRQRGRWCLQLWVAVAEFI